MIKTFHVSFNELHNDATTLSMQDEYFSTTGNPSTAPPMLFGQAKERPDLAQLIYLLTVSADGYVPITYRLANDNTPEDPTPIATWQSCCELAGRIDLLYVCDAMGYIDANRGRFLTVMPATRAEVGEVRRFIAKNAPVWTEVAHRPRRRRGGPDIVFFATPAPSPSVEGYRIMRIRSSEKEAFDAEARRRAIEQGRVALSELDEKLSAPRCRLKDETSVKAAVRVIEIFEPLCAHELVKNGQILKHYDPSLSKLLRQILDLLKVPATAYQAAPNTSLQFGEISVERPAEREMNGSTRRFLMSQLGANLLSHPLW